MGVGVMVNDCGCVDGLGVGLRVGVGLQGEVCLVLNSVERAVDAP